MQHWRLKRLKEKDGVSTTLVLVPPATSRQQPGAEQHLGEFYFFDAALVRAQTNASNGG
jgi:hypothetical protein